MNFASNSFPIHPATFSCSHTLRILSPKKIAQTEVYFLAKDKSTNAIIDISPSRETVLNNKAEFYRKIFYFFFIMKFLACPVYKYIIKIFNLPNCLRLIY